MRIAPAPYPYPRPDRAAGEYVLADVPPGDWEVMCRHEPMVRRTVRHEGRIVAYEYGPSWTSAPAKVRVLASGTMTVDFTVPVPAEIPAPPDVFAPDR